jgi:hypothetical protein
MLSSLRSVGFAEATQEPPETLQAVSQDIRALASSWSPHFAELHQGRPRRSANLFCVFINLFTIWKRHEAFPLLMHSDGVSLHDRGVKRTGSAPSIVDYRMS